MRDPGVTLVLAGLLGLLAAAGCPAQQDDVDPGADRAGAEVRPDDPTPAPAPPTDVTPLASRRAWADWPVENVAPSVWFGWRLEPSGEYTRSSGLRLAVAPNAYVLAIADGTVRETRVRDDGTIEVVVSHEDGIESRYQPLSASLVYAGLFVVRGSALGFAAGPELGLEVWAGDTAIDPLVVLRSPLSLP